MRHVQANAGQLAHCDLASAPAVRKVFYGIFDEALSELAGYRGPVGSGWRPARDADPPAPPSAA